MLLSELHNLVESHLLVDYCHGDEGKIRTWEVQYIRNAPLRSIQ